MCWHPALWREPVQPPFSPDRKITKEQLELFLQRTYALEGSNLKDDFYATVNKEALDNSVIRPGYLGASAFYDLGAKVDEEIAGIIQELVDYGANRRGERSSTSTGIFSISRQEMRRESPPFSPTWMPLIRRKP